jgi:hypothetical protein
MKLLSHDRREANAMLPLLESIAREIRDRTSAIAHAQESMELLRPEVEDEILPPLVAAVATHKKELRRLQAELADLGCSLEPGLPLTFRINGPTGRPHHAFRWRPGATTVELAPAVQAA